MDGRQTALIRASFRRALSVADLGFELFSGRLYLRNPALWCLLDVGARNRQAELLRMLRRTIEELDRFEHLAATLEVVARRAAYQGLLEAHYDIVVDTLLWTLQQVLGDGYDGPIAAAWGAASSRLVERMKEAAAAQSLEPSTLRRFRSSYPELWQGSFCAVPPPPASGRGSAPPRSSRV